MRFAYRQVEDVCERDDVLVGAVYEHDVELPPKPGLGAPVVIFIPPPLPANILKSVLPVLLLVAGKETPQVGMVVGVVVVHERVHAVAAHELVPARERRMGLYEQRRVDRVLGRG